MSQTHFGYQSVDEGDKAGRVRGVFDSVASRYDVMNDLMSLGLRQPLRPRPRPMPLHTRRPHGVVGLICTLPA